MNMGSEWATYMPPDQRPSRNTWVIGRFSTALDLLWENRVSAIVAAGPPVFDFTAEISV